MIYNAPITVTNNLTITVLPRLNTYTTGKLFVITNQSTNKSVSNTIQSVTYDANGFLTVVTTLDTEGLVDNNSYTIELVKGTTLYWRGVLLCSSQNKADYSINNGEFTEQTSTNEFIIL